MRSRERKCRTTGKNWKRITRIN